MKMFLLIAVFVNLISSLIGCETIKGLAKDMANTGDNIQDVVNGGPEFK